jgi:hypothetical protein
MRPPITASRARDAAPPILARHIARTANVEDRSSMERPQVLVSRVSGAGGSRRIRRPDRAMDVLQYGMAILAFAVALLLAVVR